ncbi:hypothetical protein [Aeromonas sp. MdU4]|uniref:hypothetical protein n=1 Tax=Aeromonas sp. MdU4 TaxID=3342819 RepID=UPI0035BB7B23
MKLFLIGCALLGCSLAIDAADLSLHKPLTIKANVDVSKTNKTAIHLKTYRNWYTLDWRPKSETHGGTFRDLKVHFNVEIDSVAAVAPRVIVNLSQLSMVCTTAKSRYYYDRMAPVTGGSQGRSDTEFGVLTVFSKIPNGGWGPDDANIKTVPGRVHIPSRFKSYSEVFDKEVWGLNGTLLFRFPWHTREVNDGGADCQGRASLVIESEI